jgi:hypothetical protein
MVAYNYLDNICDIDVSVIDNVKRDSDKVRTILHSIARNNSTLVNNKTILNDIREILILVNPHFTHILMQ